MTPQVAAAKIAKLIFDFETAALRALKSEPWTIVYAALARPAVLSAAS